MAPKKGKAKVEVDPAIAIAEESRKKMIQEADALDKQIKFETEEAAKMQLSKFQLHRTWAIDKNRVIDLQSELRVKESHIEAVKEQQVRKIKRAPQRD